MGKPSPPPAPAAEGYRDEPADAVSMHTTRDDYEYDDVPELPSYSDSEAAAASASASQQGGTNSTIVSRPIFGVDPYPVVSGSTWRQTSTGMVPSKNNTTIRMDSRLNDADELEDYVKKYLAVVPPNQLIRVIGTHQETHYNTSNKKNEKQDITDFDITFSLQSYLSREKGLWAAWTADNSDHVHRGSWRKTRAPGYRQDVEVGETEQQSLQDWCRDYCNNKSTLRVFRITRNIVSLDTEYLRKSIEGIIRSTHYHGHLHISFPIEEQHIDIYNPHWINEARLSWVRWLFYLSFLWLITWPILFFITNRWSVYTVNWFWCRCHQDHEAQRAYKVFASVSEKQWMDKHRNLLLSLVLEKYQGDATEFPTDVPDERVNQAARLALPSTGNRNVDTAINFVHGGVNAWNTVQGRGRGDMGAWGRDS